MSTLRGGDDLRKRIMSMHGSFKTVGRKWGNRAVDGYRPAVPVSNGASKPGDGHAPGRLRASFRVRNVTARRTVVGGHYTAYFVDKGPKAHTITPKGFIGPVTGSHGSKRRLVFTDGGHTVFARRVHHRGYAGRPFRARIAHDALDGLDVRGVLIDAWNRAA